MKRIVHYALLTLMWLLVVLSAASPQDVSRQQTLEQVRQRLEQIKERLQLTPEQIEQLRPILVDELQQLRSVQQKYNSSDQNRRTRLRMARELRDIRNSTDARLQKILSRKQMEELKKIREELREERRDRAGQK
jgi:hypothetical protein